MATAKKAAKPAAKKAAPAKKAAAPVKKAAPAKKAAAPAKKVAAKKVPAKKAPAKKITPKAKAKPVVRPGPPRITASAGDVLRVRSDVGPFRGQLQQGTPGWAVVPVTFPCRIETANIV